MAEPRTRPAVIYLIRHGESAHNVDPTYPHVDPPLSDLGHKGTKQIKIPVVPDLIIMSPMTRAIQTAMNIFPDLFKGKPSIEVQIWPELRAPRDATCNTGLGRRDFSAKYPHLDFSECSQSWDYPKHSLEYTTARAEAVRDRLKKLTELYKTIAVISHRGFTSYIVQGETFDFCEARPLRFKLDGEEHEFKRHGINSDTGLEQDFGPNILVPY